MISLTDEKRKELTLFLGERFSIGLVGYPYKFEDEVTSNRPFTTPDDMVALAKRMVEKGVWRKFFLFVISDKEAPNYWISLIAWLLTDPARFCWLVSEFLTKKA